MSSLFGGSKAKVVAPPDRGDQDAQALAAKMRQRAAAADDENATRAGTILGGSGPRQTATSSVKRKSLLGG